MAKIKIVESDLVKTMYRKIFTFFEGKGHVKSSSSESSGIFNFIPCFLNIEFTRFAAAIFVSNESKYFCLPSFFKMRFSCKISQK